MRTTIQVKVTETGAEGKAAAQGWKSPGKFMQTAGAREAVELSGKCLPVRESRGPWTQGPVSSVGITWNLSWLGMT